MFLRKVVEYGLLTSFDCYNPEVVRSGATSTVGEAVF